MAVALVSVGTLDRRAPPRVAHCSLGYPQRPVVRSHSPASEAEALGLRNQRVLTLDHPGPDKRAQDTAGPVLVARPAGCKWVHKSRMTPGCCHRW